MELRDIYTRDEAKQTAARGRRSLAGPARSPASARADAGPAQLVPNHALRAAVNAVDELLAQQATPPRAPRPHPHGLVGRQPTLSDIP